MTRTSVPATIAALTLLMGMAAIQFWQPVFRGRVFYAWDHTTCFLPMQVENARQRAAGEIPLWTKHLLLGYPLPAELEVSGVYPPALVFNLVSDPGRAYTLFVFLHYAIAAASTLFLSRQLGMTLLGSVVAAMVFVFGGTFSAQTFGFSLTTTFSWAPLILGFYVAAIRRRSFWAAVAGGVILAIAIVGAHPQALVYVIALLATASVLITDGATGRNALWSRLGLLAAMLLVGLALSSPQLLYFLELMRQTRRAQGLPYAELVDFSLPPHYLLQFLVPGFLGGERDYVSPAQYYELRAYFGLISLGLIGLGWKSPAPSARLFRVLLLAALVLSLGRFIGIYHLFSYLPVLRTLRGPTRILLVAALAGGILAGLGIDRLQRGEFDLARVGRGFAFAYGGLALLCLTLGLTGTLAKNQPVVLHTFENVTTWLEVPSPGLASAPGRMPNRLSTFSQAALESAAVALGCAALGIALWRGVRLQLALTLLVALLGADLLAANRRDHRFEEPDFFTRSRPFVETLRRDPELARVYRFGATEEAEVLNCLEPDPGTLLQSTAALYQVDSLNIGAASPSTSIDYFLPQHRHLTLKEIGQFNVKYLLTPVEIPPLSDRLRLHAGQWLLYENPEWQPRASIREEVFLQPEYDPDRISTTINSTAFNPTRAVVLADTPQYVGGEPVADGTEPTVTIERYGTRHVQIEAVLAHDGILLFSDLYYPGWRATTNGREIPILRANGIARGLALGPGRHRVEFVYRPDSFYRGLYVAAATAVFLLVVGIFQCALRLRSRRTPRPSIAV